jgi:glycosyltransferase involved in cell wall biosynthesis
VIEVVIPAYNAASFLRETLESIAAQSRLPAHVTVVDDRSTDGTAELARAAVSELAPRLAIRVLQNVGPQGPSAARNTAIRASDAPWIALCDSDDVLLPRHHEALAALLEAAPDIVLAFGDGTLFAHATGATLVASHNAESGANDLPAEPLGPGFAVGEAMFGALLPSGIFCTSACLFRREDALAAGLFDEAMRSSEDIDLFLRLALRGRFAFTRELITRKRVHETNLSHARNAIRFAAGIARSATRLARRAAPGAADPIAPTPAQRAALEAWLPRALNRYLYAASQQGFSAYRDAARAAAEAGRPALAASPRHLARLVGTTLRGARPA